MLRERALAYFRGSQKAFCTRVVVRLTLLLALRVLVNPSAAATETNAAMPLRLSLSQAQEIAYRSNWDLLAARSEVDQALAQRWVAREFPNPTLSLNTSKINANGNGNSTPTGNGIFGRSYDSVIAVNQLFEIGGKRSSRRASANAGLQGAEARFMDARRVLALGVAKAYIDVLAAQASAEILSQSAQSLRREAGIADARLKAGDISLVDKSQIEIEAEKLELDASSASNSLAVAKISVEVLLGIKQPTGDWQPVDTIEDLTRENFHPNERGSLAQRPDMAAAEADVKKAEAEVKLQKAIRLPDPTLQLSYEHQPPGDPSHSIGIGLSFPLPLWNRNRGAILVAEAAREKSRIQALKLEAEIAAEVTIAQRNYENASKRLQRQTLEIEPKSAEIRKAVSAAYEKGGASLLDLLSAQRNDNQVRLAKVQSAADKASALAELKAALNFSFR